ncbi:unnamed protein product, partial [Polarella glacialis]
VRPPVHDTIGYGFPSSPEGRASWAPEALEHGLDSPLASRAAQARRLHDSEAARHHFEPHLTEAAQARRLHDSKAARHHFEPHLTEAARNHFEPHLTEAARHHFEPHLTEQAEREMMAAVHTRESEREMMVAAHMREAEREMMAQRLSPARSSWNSSRGSSPTGSRREVPDLRPPSLAGSNAGPDLDRAAAVFQRLAAAYSSTDDVPKAYDTLGMPVWPRETHWSAYP